MDIDSSSEMAEKLEEVADLPLDQRVIALGELYEQMRAALDSSTTA
ncbi:MAG: hypothetical protein ACJAV4_001175 [Pontimonas sp.]|jgi:hypothetical protein